MQKKSRRTRQAVASARNANDSASEGSIAGSMEAEEQQSPGAEDSDQVPVDLDAPGTPAANMQPASRVGSRAPAGYTNPPAQSPDELAVASVLPLIGMVRSQDKASRMPRADLDSWHLHGRHFMSGLKIVSFGEVPMTAGAQQKLLIWLKDTAATDSGICISSRTGACTSSASTVLLFSLSFFRE